MFDNKSILITGGTGSFGKAFVSYVLKAYRPARVVVLSRDEMKQWQMANEFNDDRVRFFIGDVRDKERLKRAFAGIDYVVHAAASKIVDAAEYNPHECLKTNVIGAMNVIDAAIDCGVSRVVALSTDKASSPANLYGASKLASDKLFIASNSYGVPQETRFSVVRYGNVMGSRGSVIPFFMGIRGNTFPITDGRMTRFMIELKDGINLVTKAFEDMQGGEIYVKKIPSMNILDIARAVNPDFIPNFIGVRPGEKIHEQMISLEDAATTYEYEGYFKILPAIYNWSVDEQRVKNGTLVEPDFTYTSENNKNFMDIEKLREWILSNQSYLSGN
jgi:UDP-N-acetylglucosamine 4,6-dehydratase